MRNFCKIASGMDFTKLLLRVQQHPELWNQNTLRTLHPTTPHSDVDDIWLRFNDLTIHEDLHGVVNDHENLNYPAWWILPEAQDIAYNLMAFAKGQRLGRVMISRLPPGKRILPHEDGGSCADYYDRFQVQLQSLPGCIFRAGDETISMATGDIWWFQNAKEHEVVNNSADDRYAMVVDIRVAR